MPYQKLQPIKWIDNDFVANYIQSVVMIDDIPCQMFVLINGEQILQPASFGLRIKTNTTRKVLLVNNLPFSECECDAKMDMMPASGTNPCWLNLHFHGFWGSAKQDNVYACVRPGQQKQYNYTINKHHPTGFYVIHNHNFNSEVELSHTTNFPIKVVGIKPDYPSCYIVEEIFLQLLYMQECDVKTDPDCVQNGCQLTVFDFQKYASGDFEVYAKLLKESPKLLLVNGQIKPIAKYPVGKPIIFRFAWDGIMDILRLIILDDLDNRVNFRILSIDAMPIARQCSDSGEDNFIITDQFDSAHMQRFDIMVTFNKACQYRFFKYQTSSDDASPFSSGPMTIFFVDAVFNFEFENQQKLGSSNKTTDTEYHVKFNLTNLKLHNNYWVNFVNTHFRNLDNVSAWRTIRFNYPNFPEIEGHMFDPTNKSEYRQVKMVANKSEVWAVSSFEGLHSLHIHLMWFLIMAVRDSDKDKWAVIPRSKQWFQDTLILESGQQYLVWMFPFADKSTDKELRATGESFIHCHMSDHLDAGMMLSLYVDPDESATPSGVGFSDKPQSDKIYKITKKSSCCD